MKKTFLLISLITVFLASSVFAGPKLPYNTKQQLIDEILGDSHEWTDTQTFDTVDINSGTIDGTAIGDSSKSTGKFTTILGNESLGGVSTFGISGNVDLNSSSDAYLITAGRPIELRNTTPQTFRLPDMTSLSSVTNFCFFVDTTRSSEASPGSGVTV